MTRLIIGIFLLLFSTNVTAGFIGLLISDGKVTYNAVLDRRQRAIIIIMPTKVSIQERIYTCSLLYGTPYKVYYTKDDFRFGKCETLIEAKADIK